MTPPPPAPPAAPQPPQPPAAPTDSDDGQGDGQGDGQDDGQGEGDGDGQNQEDLRESVDDFTSRLGWPDEVRTAAAEWAVERLKKNGTVTPLDVLSALQEWDETQVVRHPKGTHEGGQFAPKAGGGETAIHAFAKEHYANPGPLIVIGGTRDWLQPSGWADDAAKADAAELENSARSEFSAQFKAATGNEATDADWQSAKSQMIAFRYAAGVAPPAAATVPEDQRAEVLAAAKELAAAGLLKEPGWLARTAGAFAVGAISPLEELQQLSDSSLKDRVFAKQLELAQNKQSPAGDIRNPINWPAHALTLLGTLTIGGKATPLIMAAEGVKNMQENLMAQGVDQRTATAAALTVGVVTGIVFSKLPAQLKGSKVVEEAIVKSFAKNVAKVTAETGIVNGVNNFADDIAKYTSGVTKDTHLGEDVKKTIKDTLLGLGPMSLLMTPQLARAIRSKSVGDTISATEAKSLGLPESMTDEQRTVTPDAMKAANNWAAWDAEHPGEPRPAGEPLIDPLTGKPRIYGSVLPVPDPSKAVAAVREKVKNAVRNAGTVKDITAAYDASENVPKIEAEKAANNVKQLTRDVQFRTIDGKVVPFDENCLPFLREAGGSREKLEGFQKTLDGIDTSKEPWSKPDFQKKIAEAKKGVQFALDNWDSLQAIDDKTQNILDDRVYSEQAKGFNVDHLDNYFPHDQEVEDELTGKPTGSAGGGPGSGTPFKHRRVYDTFADSMAAGVKPRTLNGIDLLKARVRKGLRMETRAEWAEMGRHVDDPTTGRALIVDAPQDDKGNFEPPPGYVLRFIGGGPGVFLNPLALFGEISHQIIQRLDRNKSLPQAAKEIANNKLGPIAKASIAAVNSHSTWEAVKNAGTALLPVPIPTKPITAAVKSVVGGKTTEQYPGEMERQLFSSFGIKSDAVPSAEQRMYGLANSFRDTYVGANGLKLAKRPDFGPGQYSELKQALRQGDQPRAEAAVKQLAQTKTAETIRSYFVRLPHNTFTGSRKEVEEAFVKSLNPEQKATHQKAIAERNTAAETFKKMFGGGKLEKFYNPDYPVHSDTEPEPSVAAAAKTPEKPEPKPAAPREPKPKPAAPSASSLATTGKTKRWGYRIDPVTGKKSHHKTLLDESDDPAEFDDIEVIQEYDPDEPRDEDGEWEAEETPEETKAHSAALAAIEASTLAEKTKRPEHYAAAAKLHRAASGRYHLAGPAYEHTAQIHDATAAEYERLVKTAAKQRFM